MSTSPFIARIPGPPDDPTFWLLSADAGWREASLAHVEISPAGHLALTPMAGHGRSPGELSGSFGGVVPPSNVAVGADGTVFLLDRDTGRLKYFDACTCVFGEIPCLGGSKTRGCQFLDPHGIAICRDNLFVCDTGHQRLASIGLRGPVRRGFWAPPRAAGLANPWEPIDVAFDRRGRAFVSDRANGCIHRFYPSGHWEKCLSGFGAVTQLAIDLRDRLYVATEGESDRVRVVDTDGRTLEVIARVEALAPRFPALPFIVDAAGNLDLTPLCGEASTGVDTAPASKVFDLRGRPTSPLRSSEARYPQDGVYLSRPLDSGIYRCQWHRVVLSGTIPRGARVTVATYTAEAEHTVGQIQDLPDSAWETRQVARNVTGDWDCLVRSGPGRFLWLRIAFKSDGRSTAEIESTRVEFPRISLGRFLPAVFAAESTSADFTDRLLGVFDTTLRSIERQVDDQARLFDSKSAPADATRRDGLDFLTWLGTWIGLTLDRRAPVAKRRALLESAARLYQLRGTREGLWRQLLLYLDMEPSERCCAKDRPRVRCRPSPANCAPVEQAPCAWQPPPLILEHFQLRRWLFVGAGRLGDQAVLWGKRIVNRSQLDAGAQVDRTRIQTSQDPFRDPFHYYAHRFTVFVPASYEKSERHRKRLETLIDAERPAHTKYYLEFVAPRLRIGVQSMIGLDSVVGRYPAGMTLDHSSSLGRTSVLGRSPHRNRASLVVGRAHVGTTTALN